MNSPDPLAQLRDIHLPEAISWWPPAPGWWILAIIVLLAVGGCTYYVFRYIRRNRYRREALQELLALNKKMVGLSTRDSVEQLAILLRRVAIQTCGRETVAPLVGEEWLRFLDNRGETNQFTSGPGEVLAGGLYRQTVEADLEKLSKLIEKWIRRSRPC